MHYSSFFSMVKIITEDVIRFRHSLTLRRILNLIKVGASLMVSKLTGGPVTLGNPFIIQVEPVNICNLKCPICPCNNGKMNREKKVMDYDLFCHLIDVFSPQAFSLFLWNYGEPMINKNLHKFISYAKKRKMMVYVCTNGHYLNNDDACRKLIMSGLDEIIISIDGNDQESYEKYRVGGSFETVLAGLNRLSRWKKMTGARSPLLQAQIIAFPHLAGRLNEIVSLARNAGAERIVIKTPSDKISADEYTEDFDLNTVRGKGDYSRFKENNDKTNFCSNVFTSIAVYVDGSVSCCYDYNCEEILGNVDSTGRTEDIIRGRSLESLKMRIMKNRDSVRLCKECPEGKVTNYGFLVGD